MSKSNQNCDESLNNFRQLISQYDQEIIQPIINEILANFEHDPSKFQASVEAWRNLSSLKTKLLQNYDDLKELIKNGYIKSKLVKDEINSFFVQDRDDVDLLYQYKGILSIVRTKSSVLVEFMKNGQKYKPVHFIFGFINDAQKIEQLIAKYNLIITNKASNGSAPIHFAAEMGNKEGFELLIDKYQVDINIENKTHRTPLHIVAVKGHANLLKKLLSCNELEIDALNDGGNTPLHLAIINGWPEIVEDLVTAHSNLDITNNNEVNSLYMSVISGYVENSKILLNYLQKERVINIDEFDGAGQTFLHLAVHKGGERMMRFLVDECKANLNIPIEDTRHVALTIAMNQDNYSMMKYLTEQGADITSVTSFKNSIFESFFLVTYYFEHLASENKENHGIFYNEHDVNSFIDNWHLFDHSLNKAEIQQPTDSNIITINAAKLLAKEQVVDNIIEFFSNRQKKLDQNTLAEMKLFKPDQDEYKTPINWKVLKNNLLCRSIITKICNGDINLLDDNVSSKIIIDELKKYVRIFLFHESKFLSENFEFEGEFKKLIIKSVPKDISTLHLMNQDNYRAMKFWENNNFLEMICLKKEGHELTVYVKQLNLQKNEESEKQNVDNNCLDELGTMVWGSKYLVTIITSHLSLEGYYNSLKMAAKEEVPLVAQDSFVDQS